MNFEFNSPKRDLTIISKDLFTGMRKNKSSVFTRLIENIYRFKAIITHGVSQILVFNLFQFGLIECFYLSTNLEEISFFM